MREQDFRSVSIYISCYHVNRYFLIDICTYDLSKLVKQARILCTALKLEVGSWKLEERQEEERNLLSENLLQGATITKRRPCLGLANLRSISVPPRSAIDTGT